MSLCSDWSACRFSQSLSPKFSVWECPERFQGRTDSLFLNTMEFLLTALFLRDIRFDRL
jgi:hypothetical protein